MSQIKKVSPNAVVWYPSGISNKFNVGTVGVNFLRARFKPDSKDRKYKDMFVDVMIRMWWMRGADASVFEET